MCRVMSVTTPGSSFSSPSASSSSPSSAGIWSASATSETRFEEVGERALGVELAELGRDGVQLGEVLDARRVLRVVARAQLGQVAGAVEDGAEDLGRARAGVRELAQPRHELREGPQRVERAVRQAGDLVDAGERRAERDALAVRERRDGALGAVAEAPLGHVEDAAQVDVVVEVVDRAQVRHGVLDLTALVEAGAPDDLVRQADADEHLLERPGLRVGAVEDRDVAGTHALGVAEAVDLLRDEPRLLVLVVGDVADHLRARARVRPQALGLAVEVARDDGVGSREDVLRRAVVLLEQDGAGVRVVSLELRGCCGSWRRGTRRSTGRRRRRR